MNLIRVIDPESEDFKSIWEICQSSFPPDERRDLDRQKGIMKKNNYRLFAAYESGICGFMSYWEVDGFVFVEHFAVKENLRSKGAGSRMMNALFHMLKGVKIVLETEPPGNETQRRRTIFYERLGFILNEFDYIQPPYGPTKKPLHMLLMSRPDQLTRTEFEEARKTIHREVYGLQDPLI